MKITIVTLAIVLASVYSNSVAQTPASSAYVYVNSATGLSSQTHPVRITAESQYLTGTGSRQSLVHHFARSDLATGELAIAASDALNPLINYNSAYASWWDWLTFSGPSPSVSFEVAINVEGTLRGLANAALSFAVTNYTTTTFQQLYGGWRTPDTYGGAYSVGALPFNVSDQTGLWTQLGNAEFRGVVTVPVGVPLYVSLSLSGGSGDFDFAHTASFGIQLPVGATFSSASGVFLSAVPEPSPFHLILLGVAALALRGRRQFQLKRLPSTADGNA